jgi:hypothetical protein
MLNISSEKVLYATHQSIEAVALQICSLHQTLREVRLWERVSNGN